MASLYRMAKLLLMLYDVSMGRSYFGAEHLIISSWNRQLIIQRLLHKMKKFFKRERLLNKVIFWWELHNLVAIT